MWKLKFYCRNLNGTFFVLAVHMGIQQYISAKLDPLKFISKLLYQFDNSECFELMIRKKTQGLVHMGII